MIFIVSGFQRCGTSLMLQMLSAGGLPIFHDPEMGYPAFETRRRSERPTWLPDEYAVKWLEPQECMPTMLPHAGKVIWMARNHREQAKSAVKFLRRVGGFQIPERQTRAAFERSYKRDTPIAVRAWARLCPVHVEFFEDVLREPLVVARRITAFTGRPLDIEAMAAQVRARSSDCYDGFLELELMNERESA